MNRRLRKKLHRGEFDTQGFEISCRFEPHLSEDAGHAILKEFIGFVEANDLGVGGGIDNDGMQFFVTRCRRTRTRMLRSWSGFRWVDEHCMVSDLALVQAWWSAFEKVVDLKVGPLRSSWHGWKR